MSEGTTPGKEEVESRREQRPRAMQGAIAEMVEMQKDCRPLLRFHAPAALVHPCTSEQSLPCTSRELLTVGPKHFIIVVTTVYMSDD